MRVLLKIFLLASSVAFIMGSCKKDENRDYLLGGSAPVLTASVSGNIPLSFANKDLPAIVLQWTNPNYQFTTGLSSQDVNYIIEIDTAGANFTNPNKQTVSVSKDLSRSFTHTEFNDFLLNQLVLKPGMSHNLEIRVTAALGSIKAAPLVSNVLKLAVTPYAIPPKVTPPSSGKLFIVGSATNGGWTNPVPVPAQEFTKISETSFELTVSLIGGQEFLLIPVNGDWSHKYAVADNTVAGLAEGGDFGFDLSKNFPGPAASGNYKIAVDFQRGKFTVTKL